MRERLCYTHKKRFVDLVRLYTRSGCAAMFSTTMKRDREPWVAIDTAHFNDHPKDHVYVRDAMKGELSSLKKSKWLVELDGADLYDLLRKHLNAFPSSSAAIRVAVLKISRRVLLRCPVVDWEGRDPSYVWRQAAGGNLQQIPAESVIAKCRALVKQENWDMQQ